MSKPIKTIIRTRIEDHEAHELACAIIGLDPLTLDEEQVQAHLLDKWQITLAEFAEIAGLLLTMAGRFKSELTGTWYRAFALVDADGSATAIAKAPIDPKNQQNWK